MVDFGAPYAMDGTIIPGAGLRRQLQRDVGTGSGVVRPGDLKITQMTPPGAGVRIAAGDDLIQCGAPGNERETYGIPLFTAQNYMGDDGAGLPGTGSQVPTGGRRDMVFHEVLDPDLPKHYTPRENWPAGASSKLSVIQNVSKTAKRIQDVPALAGVTGYALAAVTYPADTATVTNGMIEDLRRVQSPREVTEVRAVNLTGAGKEVVSYTGSYPNGGQQWPVRYTDAAAWMDIPEWATLVKIIFTISGYVVPGNARGQMWVQIGQSANPANVKTQDTPYDAVDVAGVSRGVTTVADTVKIPAALRGTKQQLYPMAVVQASVPAAQRIYADWGTSVSVTAVFQEVPD